jgi:hypothetical protein
LLQQAVALELGTHDVARQPEALRCPHLVRTEASLGARRCNCRCTFSERASHATCDFVQQVFDSCALGKVSSPAGCDSLMLIRPLDLRKSFSCGQT